MMRKFFHHHSEFVLLVGILLTFITEFTAGQRSFAETKFDLPADLPAEDLPPIAVNQDAIPSTEIAAPPPPITVAPSPSPIQIPPSSTASILPSSSSTINSTLNPKTPLPLLPNLVELPRFIMGGNIQPLTVPPTLIEVTTPNQTQTIKATRSTQGIPTSILTIQPPLLKTTAIQQNHGNGEQQLWFRDDFDTRNCPRNSDAMAAHFRRKFPRNLLRHQKEKVLAELLAIRMRECWRKQREDYWARLEKHLFTEDSKIENEREKEECRAGMIQEQIACMNVHSFSCQFIQPNFLFRLLPTRILVKEARLAEDGAEKCKKFSPANGNRKLI